MGYKLMSPSGRCLGWEDGRHCFSPPLNPHPGFCWRNLRSQSLGDARAEAWIIHCRTGTLFVKMNLCQTPGYKIQEGTDALGSSRVGGLGPGALPLLHMKTRLDLRGSERWGSNTLISEISTLKGNAFTVVSVIF